MTGEEKLKKYGATEIEGYCLISNYGYTFKINGIKYDIRFWANCYGAYLGKWEIHSCTTDEDGYRICMPQALREQIEADFNSEDE